MTQKELNTLCVSLVKANKEEDVIKLLITYNLWSDPGLWQYYGLNENNFSIIGNQQGSADRALVEKIINSVDAVLTKECIEKGIDPESNDAPSNTEKALEKFFGIYNGKLTNLDVKKRSELAENISLVATGSKINPCYSIIDLGEGQTPSRIPNTLLSLSKSNKLKIPFVQGKYNMGSTGALQFCGHNNLQLIITKRNPNLISKEEKDNNNWSFTIIRRENPSGGLRSSSFKYLAPNGEILNFYSNALPLLPGEYPDAFGKNMYFGTYIKLYEYNISPYKSMATLDLFYRLSLLMPKLALPVRIYERRKGYKGHTLESVLSGLYIRLDEDKRKNLEPGFPGTDEISIDGEKLDIQIYAFQKNQKSNYARNEGIVFVVNGQSHGSLDKSFFSRKNVKMDYIADSILVMVDCSNLEGRTREDLFMTSRDRLREGTLLKKIEKSLEELIGNHPGLRELRERRRREFIKASIEDNKALQDVLEKVIKTNPTLAKLLIKGLKITNPLKLDNVAEKKIFIGKRFPTFFKLEKDYTKDKPKLTPINNRLRINFETDAINDYLNREDSPGEVSVELEGIILKDYIFNLWNGVATLNMNIPECIIIGDVFPIKVIIDDDNTTKPFVNTFYIKALCEDKSVHSSSQNKRKNPADNNSGSDRQSIDHLDLPNIFDISRDSWEKYGFNEESALLVKDSGDKGYDFFINIDNIYLIDEIKNNTKIEPEILKNKYKNALALIGLSFINYINKQKENKHQTENTEKKEKALSFDLLSDFTSSISPVLIPIITLPEV